MVPQQQSEARGVWLWLGWADPLPEPGQGGLWLGWADPLPEPGQGAGGSGWDGLCPLLPEWLIGAPLGAAWLRASGSHRQCCFYAAELHCSLLTQPYSFPKLPLALLALRKPTPSFSQAKERWQTLPKLHLVKGQAYAKG